MRTSNTSVTNLVQELEERIALLTSTKVRANLNPATYESIIEIIKKYTKRTPQELRPQDIALFKVDDIKEVLKLMDVSTTEINRIITQFNPNVLKYQSNDTNIETEKYFERICNMIVNYIIDYRDINSNQKEAQDEKVSEYQRYIELLRASSIDEPFEDFDGLMKLMSTVATSNEDKWHILAYVADLNIGTSKLAMADINYGKRLSDMLNKYVKDNPEIVEVVQKALYRNDIDIDLIPSLSETLAKETGASVILMQNIIVTILAVNVHSNYLTMIGKDEETENKLKDMLDAILEQGISENAELIEKAENILDANASLIATTPNLIDEEILQYVDKSLSELEEEGYTREEAIDLKILPILKTLAETLDKIRTLDEDDPDYIVCADILKGLNDAYESIIEKNEMKLEKN